MIHCILNSVAKTLAKPVDLTRVRMSQHTDRREEQAQHTVHTVSGSRTF